jgi:hypothetical protein
MPWSPSASRLDDPHVERPSPAQDGDGDIERLLFEQQIDVTEREFEIHHANVSQERRERGPVNRQLSGLGIYRQMQAGLQ